MPSYIGGTYRVDDVVFPAPESTAWQPMPIEEGLDGFSINGSYWQHTWTYRGLPGETAKLLFELYDNQQANRAQLGVLETDDYAAAQSDAKYSTVEYTDFIIKQIAPRTRGLPFYDSISVLFEVYIG